MTSPRFIAPVIGLLGLVSLLIVGCSTSITKEGIWIGPAQPSAKAPRPAQKPQPPVVASAPRAPLTTPSPKPQKLAAATVSGEKPAAKATSPSSGSPPKPEPLPAIEPPVTWEPPLSETVYLYVSPTGDDINPGTETAPFRTITRAQQEVRALNTQGRNANITVYLRGGTHALEATLVFTPADGGNARQRVVYTAVPGEQPVLSGGRKIAGWSQAEHGLWVTTLPDIRDGGHGFRDLFVNGQHAQRSRSPVLARKPPYYEITDSLLSDDLQTWEILLPAPLPKIWKDIRDAEFVGISLWEITRKPIESIEPETGKIRLRGPHWKGNRYTLPIKGRSCYLENAREFLVGPGQWYLDRTQGVLYYWPRSGEKMMTADVVAPTLSQLLAVRGTTEQPVANLHFEGIEFCYTDWPLPATGFRGHQAAFCHTKEGVIRVEEAVRFEFATSCSLRNCRLRHLGGSGLGLGRGCSQNLILGNRFHDIGATGVMVGEDKDPERPSEAVCANAVFNNEIYGAGQTYFGAVGIWVGLTENTSVIYNWVHDLPYTGISVGWIWNTKPSACKGNRIEFNQVADVMKTLKDGGGIYTLGLQPGTVIRGNLMERVGGYAALYLDAGSSSFLIESNVVRDTWTPIRFNSQRLAQTWGFNFFDGSRLAPGKVGQGLLVSRQSFARGEYRVPAATDAFTISVWVKPQKLAQQTYVFSKGKPNQNDEFSLLLQQTKLVGRLNLGGGATNQIALTSADGLIRPNVWHHVALTFGEQTLRLFLNGELVAERTTEKTRRPTDEMIGIGTVSSGTTGMLDGTIDEVRLYKRSLTAAEIATLYRTPADLPGLAADSDLIGQWDFEDLTDPGPAQARIVNQAGLQEPYRTQFGE